MLRHELCAARQTDADSLFVFERLRRLREFLFSGSIAKIERLVYRNRESITDDRREKDRVYCSVE